MARNIPVVKYIYHQAFKNPRYNASNQNIPILSYENMRGSPYKDLNQLLKKEENIKQLILVDDNRQYSHPQQQINFMEINAATDKTFENIHQTKSFFEEGNMLAAANHIYFVAGLLAKVIKIAEKTNCTLSEALDQLLSPPDLDRTTVPLPKNTYRPNILIHYQTYYVKGLKKLQEINRTLRFSTKGKFFSDEYTLHPATPPFMAVPKGDGDEAETKESLPPSSPKQKETCLH